MHLRTCFIILIFLILTSLMTYGEGTKQLRPDSTVSEAGLYFDSGSTGYTRFGIINCLPNYRLYIHVKNAGESILFGMQNSLSNVSYNLRKPNGTIAMTGGCPAASNQPGYISYYRQAVVGPFPLNSGYTPLSYQVTSIADTGNYYFELFNVYGTFSIDLWDFQVVSGQHTPAVPSDTINGRVWSQSWQLWAPLTVGPYFNGRFFIYSDDGIVTRLAFNNTRVGAVTIFCNPYGCLNTGNFENDRKSMNSNTFITFPGIAQYKVFLNNPDSTLYPSGVYGQITNVPYMISDTAFSPCSSNKSIIVEVNKAGSVEVVITIPYGAPATTVNFFAPVVPGTNHISWDGKDGLGNQVTEGTLINASVTFVNGLTNLPIWDQEQNQNGFNISLVRPVNPSVITPLTYWDDTQLLSNTYLCPVAPQAANLTGCSPGSIQGYSGCHPWGLNSDDCHDKMINTWWYGSTSVATFQDFFITTALIPQGHGASRCGPGSLILHATVQPPATADWYDTISGGTPLVSGDTTFNTPVLQASKTYYAEARNPASGCLSGMRVAVVAGILPVPMPTVTGPTTVCKGTTGSIYVTESGNLNYIWSVSPGGMIIGGFGTNAIQVAWNAAGYQSVSVNYTDTSGCDGIAPALLRVAVVPAPAMPGIIQGVDSVCSGTTGVHYLVDSTVSATTYSWSVPPGAIVTAGAGTHEITVDFPQGATSGNITVYGTNMCGNGPPTPPFPVTVVTPPNAVAGPDDSICQALPYEVFQATASGYSRLAWHSSGTGRIQDSTLLNPIYIPGTGETGTVTLTLIATGILPCGSVASAMNLIIVPSPAANAGKDISSCGLSQVYLSDAAASDFSSLAWSSSGTGTFSDPHALHPVYTPGPGDPATGQIILALTATGSSLCPAKQDRLVLYLGQRAIVNAGADGYTCGATPFVPGTSMAQNYSSILWSTTGTGTFSDPMALHPVFTPGQADIISGKVSLIITASGTGNCEPVSDTLLLLISAPPEASAGPDMAICAGGQVMVSGASARNYITVTWTHDGTGSLSGANQLTPVYIPSQGETGTITLTFRASGIESCAADTASDRMQILIYQELNTDAGTDQSITYGSTVKLTGSAEGGSGNYSYQWEPAELLTDFSAASPETLPLSQTVTFLLKITDLASGCTGSDTVRITVGTRKNTEECLVIYNVITPNGDGQNDTWVIDCIDNFPVNKVTVFNRWGDKINEFENYNNTTTVWKGTDVKNEQVPDGTYYYIVAIKDGGTYTGWVFVRGGTK